MGNYPYIIPITPSYLEHCLAHHLEAHNDCITNEEHCHINKILSKFIDYFSTVAA